MPDSVEFATKPVLARQMLAREMLAREMLARALAAQVPAAWVTADEVYGSDYTFRRFCEERRLNYVVAISSATHLALGWKRQAVSKHLAEIPEGAWQRLSCGAGSKGQREYDWAYITWPHHEQATHANGWLVRRNLDASREPAFYFTYASQDTPLEKIVQVAGSRWAIEECFEQAKQETGLDDYEVRSWLGWHRHITLAMLAHATLAVLRSQAAPSATPQKTMISSR